MAFFQVFQQVLQQFFLNGFRDEEEIQYLDLLNRARD
jgi:hypothetical protein